VRIAISILMFVVSTAALSAELFYMDHDAVTGKYVGATGPLVLSGEIVPGDYGRLLSKIADDENRFLIQNKLVLASSEGDVGEAIKIGQFVKALYSAVTVGPMTGKCVGACFLIYAAASQRMTDGERLIGVSNLEQSAAARAFLRESAVPSTLVDEMLRLRPNEVYWLSALDEAHLGDQSPSFHQLLVTKCMWDENTEREVYAGKRPFEDLKTMLMCRARLTQSAARAALAAALKARAQ
jgi:hypothetical protein